MNVGVIDVICSFHRDYEQEFLVLWLKGREDPVRFHFGAEIAGAKVGKP